MQVRPAQARDHNAIWGIIGPTIRAGETYVLPRDMSREAALSYWTSPGHEVFIADADGQVLGTYYMRPNQQGGGAHVANCGYMTAAEASGRGVARAMCAHSLDHARARGFRAIQFNFVVSSNERAIALWQSFAFEIVGRLPQAFEHPRLGLIDALVMYRML
ncbi:MAG TPA: GNAT family N-acetyltransferase [Xanthobacteraceae bacterium]|jgi:ribosomal protein S18 acetylase RimI-like enzyme